MRPTTIRELCDELGLRSPSSGQARLRSLERIGVISRGNGRAHALNEEAVMGHLRRAAHRLAVEAHYEQYPEDRPSRAEVAFVDLRRRGDALADRADLLDLGEQVLLDAGEEPTTDQVVAAARVLAATDAA